MRQFERNEKDRMSQSHPYRSNRRKFLVNGTLLAAGSSLRPSIFGQVVSGEHRWTISNSAIQRILTFRNQSGLVTEQLSALTPAYQFISSAPEGFAHEFSFRCNGQFCAGTGTDFTLGSEPKQRSGERDSKILTITLRHKTLPLEVSVETVLGFARASGEQRAEHHRCSRARNHRSMRRRVGSSIASLTRTRKVTASRPSMIRWS